MPLMAPQHQGFSHPSERYPSYDRSMRSPTDPFSSQPVGLLIPQEPLLHGEAAPTSAAPPSSHREIDFRPFAPFREEHGYPMDSPLTQHSVAPSDEEDSYMIDAFGSSGFHQAPLLNDHPQFVYGRPFSGRTGHVAVHQPLNSDDTHEFLSFDEFNIIADEYVQGLSDRKQDKALLPAWRCSNIRDVLKDPKATNVETAQFRFWAKKMFRCKTVAPFGTDQLFDLVTHESKPVACRESIYKILVDCHRLCAHGGRDKTSAQVRKLWSWIPKELIARFVKNCPKCEARRNVKNMSPSSEGLAGPSPPHSGFTDEDSYGSDTNTGSCSGSVTACSSPSYSNRMRQTAPMGQQMLQHQHQHQQHHYAPVSSPTTGSMPQRQFISSMHSSAPTSAATEYPQFMGSPTSSSTASAMLAAVTSAGAAGASLLGRTAHAFPALHDTSYLPPGRSAHVQPPHLSPQASYMAPSPTYGYQYS